MKLVIIGNAGSGKTWLATRVSQRVGCSMLQLDDLFWMLGGTERGPTDQEVADVKELVSRTKEQPAWVAEGAQSRLARMFLDAADSLVWLDFDWEYCRQRILERRADAERKGEPTLGSSDWLIEFASGYYERSKGVAWSAHEELLDAFRGETARIRQVEELDRFLGSLPLFRLL